MYYMEERFLTQLQHAVNDVSQTYYGQDFTPRLMSAMHMQASKILGDLLTSNGFPAYAVGCVYTFVDGSVSGALHVHPHVEII